MYGGRGGVNSTHSDIRESRQVDMSELYRTYHTQSRVSRGEQTGRGGEKSPRGVASRSRCGKNTPRLEYTTSDRMVKDELLGGRLNQESWVKYFFPYQQPRRQLNGTGGRHKSAIHVDIQSKSRIIIQNSNFGNAFC